MRCLLFILLCSLRAFGAVGDATGIEIATGGARIYPRISGLNSNGMFYNGFGTNNSITGTQKLTLTVNAPGFSLAGVSQRVDRVIYGTKLERLLWPNDGTNNIATEGDGCIPGIWLSGYVDAGEIVTATAAAGYYAVTNGSGTNATAFTAQTVTNSSTQPYVVVLANWAPRTPRCAKLTNNTVRLSVVAFHNSGRDRKPVQLVRVITTGLTSGLKTTNDATRMQVDVGFNSQAPYWNVYTNIGNISAGTFIVDVDLSGFTPLEILRHDFIAYPIIGDLTAVVNTTLDTYPLGSPMPTQIRNLYDPNNAHSRVVAVVSNLTGNDAAAVCATNGDPDSVFATPFLTIGAALIRCAASNNTFFGHNDTSGVIIYCIDATNYPGINITVTTVPTVAPIIRPYGGSNITLVRRISADSTTHMKRVVFEDINTAWATTEIPFFNYDYVKFVRGNHTSVSTGPLQNCTNVFFIHGRVGSFAQGLRSVTTQNTDFWLEGLDLKDFNQAIVDRVTISCVHPDTNGPSYTISSGSSNTRANEGGIRYNNYFGGGRLSGNLYDTANYGVIQVGFADVQNVYEKALGGQPSGSISTGNTNGTNIIRWHCLDEGGRIADLCSFQDETNVVWRLKYSFIGNVWSYPGQKNDAQPPGSTNRYGGWDQMNMVGGRGNFYIRNFVTTATLSFRPEFAGMWTYEPSYTNVANFCRWINRKAALQGVNTEGGSNFRCFADAPQIIACIGFNSPLPFDIVGNARGEFSPPGPYSESDPRK